MSKFVDQTGFELRLVGYGKWVGFDIHGKKVVKSSKSTITKYYINLEFFILRLRDLPTENTKCVQNKFDRIHGFIRFNTSWILPNV